MIEFEKRILKLFTFNERLKFSEIALSAEIRSNKLAYHLKNLVKKGILERNQEYYQLTEAAENLIPYLSEKNSPLVVILIRIGDRKKCFLYPREKRPFKGKISLPGGRLLVNETLKEAVKRIMKEKYKINARFKKVVSANQEFVIKNKKIIHSFILILVEACAKDKIKLEEVNKNKKRIINSDYNLIISKNRGINIKTFFTNS